MGKEIIYTDEPIAFIGNRKMLKWAFDNTKIPHDLIYKTTGFDKKQVDEWISNSKSFMSMDAIQKFCKAFLIPLSVFFLDPVPTDEEIPSDVTVLDGLNFVISREELLRIEYSVNKSLESEDIAVLKMGLYHVLTYLAPYFNSLQYY